MKIFTKLHLDKKNALSTALHPERPWILISLANSNIELWDYRVGAQLMVFTGHSGPVRSVDFHSTKPIFVSAGDDTTIRVWSLETFKQIYVLKGHIDFVRTAFFHKLEPWIISASDDQSIRIWNWQSRQEIAALLGHNDYVMCANFHPTKLLVASASADKTVRIWDISSIQKKQYTPLYKENKKGIRLNFQDVVSQNIFSDCPVKFILNEHSDSVNWVTFHPKLDLVASCSDDKKIITWQYNEKDAKLKNIYQGHTEAVTCVAFHPLKKLFLSTSQDCTIQVWDINESESIKKSGKKNQKFWYLSTMNDHNLVSTITNSEVLIFKINKDRPCFSTTENKVIFINQSKQVQLQDIGGTVPLPSLSLKKFGLNWMPFHSISYNHFCHTLLVNQGNGQCLLLKLPKVASGAVEPHEYRTYIGDLAMFLSKDEFFLYIKSKNLLEVHSVNNELQKSINIDSEDNIISFLVTTKKMTYFICKDKISQFDISSEKVLRSITLDNIKSAFFSINFQYIAVTSEDSITIVSKNLEILTVIKTYDKIKSIFWNENNVIIFSTPNHLKYALVNGDTGIIKSLHKVIYIVGAKGDTIYYLDKTSTLQKFRVDFTECLFKKALRNRNFPEILKLINESNLVGNNILYYSSQAGYPEIALRFTRDHIIRFKLALKTCNIDIALNEAQYLNDKTIWYELSQYTLALGNVTITEMCFKKLNMCDELAFLYLISGELEKLKKLGQISQNHKDIPRILTNTFYNGSLGSRAALFLDMNSFELSYLTAKENNDTVTMEKCLAKANILESEIVWPDFTKPERLVENHSVIKTTREWPLSPREFSYFEEDFLK